MISHYQANGLVQTLTVRLLRVERLPVSSADILPGLYVKGLYVTKPDRPVSDVHNLSSALTNC